MEDEKLKALFADFSPSIGDDDMFMTRLQRNIEAVEFIKQQALQSQRRNRKAVAVSAAVGFICGVIFTLCYPYLKQAIGSLGSHIAGAEDFVAEYNTVILWSIICITTTVLVYVAYDISIAVLSKCKMRLKFEIAKKQY